MSQNLPTIPSDIYSKFSQFLDFTVKNKNKIPKEIWEVLQDLQGRLHKYRIAPGDLSPSLPSEQHTRNIVQIKSLKNVAIAPDSLPTEPVVNTEEATSNDALGKSAKPAEPVSELAMTAELAADNTGIIKPESSSESTADFAKFAELAADNKSNTGREPEGVITTLPIADERDCTEERLAMASLEISRFLKAQANKGELTEEISKFMESLEKSLSVSSDFALYENTGAKDVRKQKQPLADYMGQPATQRKPKVMPQAHHIIPTQPASSISVVMKTVLKLAIVLLGCMTAGYFIAISLRQTKSTHLTGTEKTPPQHVNHQTPLAVTKTPTPDKTEPQIPVKVEPAPVPKEKTTTTELERFLAADAPDLQEVSSNLLAWKNQAACSPQDIALLARLYEKYDGQPHIAAMIALIINQMQDAEAKDWVNRKITNMQSNKIAISEQLLRNDAERGKGLVLTLLQKESHPRVCLKLIQMLVNQYPEDKQVCDEIVSRFQQLPDETLRSSILSLITRLNPEPSFFVSVVANNQYSLATRLNTLDAVLNYANTNKFASKNNSFLIFELNEVATGTEDELLQRKIVEVIQHLSARE